jgi:hypothetical protein
MLCNGAVVCVHVHAVKGETSRGNERGRGALKRGLYMSDDRVATLYYYSYTVSSHAAALLPSPNFYCSKYTSISASSGSSSSSSSDGTSGSTHRGSLVIVELFSLL